MRVCVSDGYQYQITRKARDIFVICISINVTLTLMSSYDVSSGYQVIVYEMIRKVRRSVPGGCTRVIHEISVHYVPTDSACCAGCCRALSRTHQSHEVVPSLIVLCCVMSDYTFNTFFFALSGVPGCAETNI